MLLKLSNVVFLVAILLGVVSVTAGFGVNEIALILGGVIPNANSVRWVFVLGMPILLWVVYIRLSLKPTNNWIVTALQLLSLITTFLVPFYWIFFHLS